MTFSWIVELLLVRLIPGFYSFQRIGAEETRLVERDTSAAERVKRRREAGARREVGPARTPAVPGGPRAPAAPRTHPEADGDRPSLSGRLGV
jgi:hypothetical protein